MLESLELRIARSKIQRYEHDADEAIVRASKQAQDCMDCEEFLDKGIVALEWLERVEEVLAEAACEGVFEMHAEVEEAIENLHIAWMRPCPFANRWLAKCEKNGYQLRNLTQFRECCGRAVEWLDRNALYKQSKAAREERFAQEPW